MRIEKGTSGQWAAQTGRACGECSLCCKLLYIKELDKPANQWCPHCRPGKGGCSIWGATHDICKTYFCGWRLTSAFGDEWFPLKSHMVVSLTRPKENGVQVLMVTVDPLHGEAWRREPYRQQLREWARRGATAADAMVVIVRVGVQSWHIDGYGSEREIADNSVVVSAASAKL
jgi:RNase P protein component